MASTPASALLLAAMLLCSWPAAADDGDLYIVGQNDVLAILVYDQPQLSGKYVVDADGTFTFPLLGRVAVGGLTLRGIEAEIRARLAEGILKDPQIRVTVEQYRSQQVFVMGEVRQPGTLQYTGAMTLLEALARVGATTERAAAHAIIVRSENGRAAQEPADADALLNADTSHLIRVDLEALRGGALSENIALRGGDTVFVPQAEVVTIFVSGHVRAPGQYVIREATTVRQALALAGGVTDRGSERRIQIVRQRDGSETTTGARLQDPVLPGDTIVVRERFF